MEERERRVVENEAKFRPVRFRGRELLNPPETVLAEAFAR
jgi:hypothetical protein